MDMIFILADFCGSKAGKKVFGFAGQIFDMLLIIVPMWIYRLWNMRNLNLNRKSLTLSRM